jgi:protease-4
MSQTQVESGKSGKRILLTVVIYVVVIAAVAIGSYFLAPVIYPTPKIAILDMTYEVSTLLSDVLSRQVEYAINDPDIKAVVVVINSPGGSASAGHDIYYQLRRLRETKPVVASVDIGAFSAAYQIAVAANEIYAKPASMVGNVGVIMGQPSPDTLSEQYTTTGPYKSIGASATGFLQKQDLIFNDFRDSVVAERSAAPNPLKLSPEKVATGEIWVGLEAMDYGLIDAIGSRLDAIDAAAKMVGLKKYQVVDLRTEYLASLGAQGDQSAYQSALKLFDDLDKQPKIDLSTQQSKYPAFYQIYIPLE